MSLGEDDKLDGFSIDALGAAVFVAFGVNVIVA